MIISENIAEAVHFLTNGDIIAYPTEGVFGLGCDPFNEQAVMRLLALKQRPQAKGLILLASGWDQIKHLIMTLNPHQQKMIESNMREPITWVIPASSQAPNWIIGEHHGIAIRVSHFPLVRHLCDKFNKPIVSTSANITGQSALTTTEEVGAIFQHKIAFILQGKVGNLNKPTQIRDLLTGAILRA